MEWQDELTLIAETAAENRVNKNGFAVKPEESARTVFCNKKTVGYSEYFKSQQTGKLVEAKYEVHKADYGGEDVVEVNGRRVKFTANMTINKVIPINLKVFIIKLFFS